MNKVLVGVISLCIANFAMADMLYCNAGVTIYHSKYSASLEQANGTRANFEYYSIIQTMLGDVIGYRGTDIPGVLGIPKIINGTVKVMLELDGRLVPFLCHEK